MAGPAAAAAFRRLFGRGPLQPPQLPRGNLGVPADANGVPPHAAQATAQAGAVALSPGPEAADVPPQATGPAGCGPA